MKDLLVDRAPLDRMLDADLILVAKPVTDSAVDATACIQCGARVAERPNSAAKSKSKFKNRHMLSRTEGGPLSQIPVTPAVICDNAQRRGVIIES